MEARAGQCGKEKGKKSMLLTYGCGEEFYKFSAKSREQTFQFWKT
jgi:hypothetical protein